MKTSEAYRDILKEDELFLAEFGETTMRETVWETVARLVESFATVGSKDPTSGQFL